MEAVRGVSYVNWKGTVIGSISYLVCSLYIVLMYWDYSVIAFEFLNY